MNLILFDPQETSAPLPCNDPRARHLLDVLRRREGDTFDAGLVNGPRGKGTLAAIGGDALTLVFTWGEAPPPPDPVALLIGLPRPQTARDILRDATTLGVAALHFVLTEKSERNYAQSALWSTGEWRRHLLAGAAQACDTRIPEVTWDKTLLAALAAAPVHGTRLALDNYESAALFPVAAHTSPLALAFGPERGWGAEDRASLRAHGFIFTHLGRRPLRSETAVVAALAVLKSARNTW